MYGDYEKHRELEHFIGAIKVKNFISVEEFKKNVGIMIDDIHNTPSARGFDRVLVPREKEHLTQLKYEKESIPIPSETVKELQSAAQELNVAFPSSS
jgi:LDH2 family malate/lactate/ureidoglycolate dehydrogenase